MEDIVVLYKLHEEMGRVINLYDWFQSFLSLHGEEEDTVSLQARFVQGTSELQMLGFIKPYNRKIDHVAKLTFMFS